jgi:predicted XRE-type DNA-binding protein
MKKQKHIAMTTQELAKDWGIDYQAYKIKSSLIALIKDHCYQNEISQRKLAKMVPGLTQDRVSKIFSGQVGHMTIDKLVAILSALEYTVDFKIKAA